METEIECNKRLINEVAEELGCKISQVELILKGYSDYISNTIRSGNMEGVRIPYLGSIQVKHERQQYKAHLHALVPVYRKLFEDATNAEIVELLKYEE